MNTNTIIHEIAFEKECSIREAREIYEDYKENNKLPELLDKLKYHKEI